MAMNNGKDDLIDAPEFSMEEINAQYEGMIPEDDLPIEAINAKYEAMIPSEKPPEPTDSSFLGNVAKNIAATAADKVADTFGFLDTVAQGAEEAFQKVTGINPVLYIGEDGISFEMNADTKRPSIAKTGQEKLKEIGEGIGYTPKFTWKNFKGEMTAKNFAGFVIEQGATSPVDMAMAMLTLPTYIASNTYAIGEARAKNNKQDDVTINDLVEAAPTALLTSLVERLASKYVTSAPELAAIPKSAGVEGVTEFIQGATEYIGETAGTKKNLSLAEGFDRSLAGALVGLGAGAGMSAASIPFNKNKTAEEDVSNIIMDDDIGIDDAIKTMQDSLAQEPIYPGFMPADIIKRGAVSQSIVDDGAFGMTDKTAEAVRKIIPDQASKPLEQTTLDAIAAGPAEPTQLSDQQAEAMIQNLVDMGVDHETAMAAINRQRPQAAEPDSQSFMPTSAIKQAATLQGLGDDGAFGMTGKTVEALRSVAPEPDAKPAGQAALDAIAAGPAEQQQLEATKSPAVADAEPEADQVKEGELSATQSPEISAGEMEKKALQEELRGDPSAARRLEIFQKLNAMPVASFSPAPSGEVDATPIAHATEPYDAARAQELKNSIEEGESILRTKSHNGKKYSAGKLAAVELSVKSSKDKLAALGTVDIAPAAIEATPARADINKLKSYNNIKDDDTLLQAIAKSGGLNMEEAVAQGIDPASFKAKRGRHNALRKEGKSFDQMAEAMSELGYLPEKYTANELLDLVSDQLAGKKHYTPRGLEIIAEKQHKVELADRAKRMRDEIEADFPSIGLDHVTYDRMSILDFDIDNDIPVPSYPQASKNDSMVAAFAHAAKQAGVSPASIDSIIEQSNGDYETVMNSLGVAIYDAKAKGQDVQQGQREQIEGGVEAAPAEAREPAGAKKLADIKVKMEYKTADGKTKAFNRSADKILKEYSGRIDSIKQLISCLGKK